MENQNGNKKLAVSILSLSLLTVMAGAAVAPALDVIREHFSSAGSFAIQMVISMPAIFIVLTNLVFPELCRRIRVRSLLMIGLLLYTVGGVAAGAMNSIGMVLAARALVGIGVGIVMPLSTGLLPYYFSRDKQDILMGYASAMNQMGAAVATLISGVLATFSWRASFLVYLMGLISIVLCLRYLPNDYIGAEKKKGGRGLFRKNASFVIAMFILMVTFFIYPADFAMETVSAGVIDPRFIAPIMASMDLVAFFGGLAFVHVKHLTGRWMRFVAPLMFLAGYLLLRFLGGWAGTLLGSWMIGFANGLGIPFIIAAATKKAGRAAAATVMPLISAALYLGQFLTPMILSCVRAAASGVSHLPYMTAIVTAVILVICSAQIKEE
ncbi:MAG: MFS transporter [Anaerovoracaceae bacterium]|jgi:MFS family permease